jgi:hypothetical protein
MDRMATTGAIRQSVKRPQSLSLPQLLKPKRLPKTILLHTETTETTGITERMRTTSGRLSPRLELVVPTKKRVGGSNAVGSISYVINVKGFGVECL